MEKQKRKPRPDVALRNKSKAQREAVSLSWQGDTEKRRKRISKAVSKSLLGNKRRWLGDEAGYSAIHKYVLKYWDRPECCEHCGVKDRRFHWANLDGKYTRSRKDWASLCPSCHKKYDLTNNVTMDKFRLP